MTNWSSKLGKGGRLDLGIGASVPPASLAALVRRINHNSWRHGYVSFDAKEDVPESGSPLLQDVESTVGDALRRAPGIQLVESVSPRSLQWLFEHAAADFAANLIAIDPPYIGVKYQGDMVFTDEGIVASSVYGWNVTNVAGILVFSNGTTATYLRDFATGAITDISASIIALTFGNAFGRTFAGAVTGISLESLRIKWNASNADPADWAGAGSGNTLLVSNQPDADRIMAIRPLGFDVLAVLCRKNLWLGYPTGDPNEPADFRVRFPGIGIVSERTACVCPEGVIALSDAGVVLFNINEAKILSEKIANVLLPLNYVRMNEYYAIYNAPQRRYQLYTPEGVFCYDLPSETHPEGRWFFRGYTGVSAATFTDQSGNYFWNTIPGTWLDWNLTWNEMAISQENAASHVFNGDETGEQLGLESYGVEQYFDQDQDAYWSTRQSAEDGSSLQTTEGVEIEYVSTEDCDIELAVLDPDGVETGATTKTLPNSMGARITRKIWFVVTGQGTDLKLSMVTGRPEIYRVVHILNGEAPAVEAI